MLNGFHQNIVNSKEQQLGVDSTLVFISVYLSDIGSRCMHWSTIFSSFMTTIIPLAEQPCDQIAISQTVNFLCPDLINKMLTNARPKLTK